MRESSRGAEGAGVGGKGLGGLAGGGRGAGTDQEDAVHTQHSPTLSGQGQDPDPTGGTGSSTSTVTGTRQQREFWKAARSPTAAIMREEAVCNMPYRTTPLVLPGAKVKKEDSVTDCYLRHHPNPMMRAPPGHGGEWLPADVVMKQKSVTRAERPQVADTVLQRVVPSDPGRHNRNALIHVVYRLDYNKEGKVPKVIRLFSAQVVNKPFNTPIGLYSEQNIVDTIHKTLGTPLKPTVVYDPAKSETYKFLQEQELGDHVQEVTVPPQPKVFTPNKVPAARRINPPPTQRVHQKTISTAPNPYYHVNTMGVPAERIQQSGSFNRLMHMVMNDM
ncbi:PDZ and LIM domain protein 3 [Frankliniella fusca]|uniref:PDZ and LIM domain protein 3 n=1 Tax=Frankliniella fusca TaxID=407009 RepID=A0AAE1HKQ9_9NEOP|nr:PDZ and LIM domain protein 3 [Frankliniella fusca]